MRTFKAIRTLLILVIAVITLPFSAAMIVMYVLGMTFTWTSGKMMDITVKTLRYMKGKKKQKPAKTQTVCKCGCGEFLSDSDLIYSNDMKLSCKVIQSRIAKLKKNEQDRSL